MAVMIFAPQAEALNMIVPPVTVPDPHTSRPSSLPSGGTKACCHNLICTNFQLFMPSRDILVPETTKTTALTGQGNRP